ncbi:hypothetical protein [Sporosarcina cyprini]|uniref:hypothetical protein n=1 Tax=Sporosarcina cyprini TaxID=2910523 RepID=UPI001EDCC73F|nr:hypothetical protein [Sporosarcina cyprini]MCG3089771.1 hypothetical protein [Sporosarcina cyprini]
MPGLIREVGRRYEGLPDLFERFRKYTRGCRSYSSGSENIRGVAEVIRAVQKIYEWLSELFERFKRRYEWLLEFIYRAHANLFQLSL